MSKWIDADALNIYNISPADGFMVMGVTEEDIDLAPSIDIVRCRECRYFIDNLAEDDTDEAYGECCFDWDIKMPKADDFCSYGERRVSDD